MRGRRLDRAAPTVRGPRGASVLGSIARAAIRVRLRRHIPSRASAAEPSRTALASRGMLRALAARSPRSPPPAPPPRPRHRSAIPWRASCPSSCTTAATRRRSPRSRRSPARCPACRTGEPEPTVYGRRAGRWLQYWMFFAAQDQDRGLAAHRPPRGRLGGRAVRGPRRRAGPRRLLPAPRRGALSGGRDPDDAAAGARSSSSRTARTRPTSSPACATGCGPTRTTRPTGRGRACARGWSASPRTPRRG